MRHTSLVPRCVPEGTCITCSDEGVTMTIRTLDAETGLAVCRAQDGGESEVDVSLVEAAAAGDVVLVHAGVALARVEAAV